MSTLKKLAKKAARGVIKSAVSAVKLTPLGMATTTVASAFGGGGRGGGPGTAMQQVGRVDRPGVIDLPGGFGINLPWAGPPGVGFMGPGQKRGRVAAGPKGECPKGYHLNRSKTSDGMPEKSFCVRNRHVNYANGRAAARSGRRLRGTVRMLRRSFTLVSARPAKGKWIPKGRGKR